MPCELDWSTSSGLFPIMWSHVQTFISYSVQVFNCSLSPLQR